MIRPLKQLSKKYLFVAVFKNFCSEKFLQIIIKASVEDFIFSKIPCFQHILLNAFRRMLLNYEKNSFMCTLFQTLKQHSDFKSLIVKAFDGNTFRMKAASPV